MSVDSNVVQHHDWRTLAEIPVVGSNQMYLLSVNGVPAMVTPDHSVMSHTVIGFQRSGKNVRVDLVLNDPTEDELNEAGLECF